MADDTEQSNSSQDTKEDQGKDDSIEDDFEALQQEYEELEEKLKRTHADFQNYKKRVKRRREQRENQAIRSLVNDLLPYLDNQELTLQEADDYESLRESVELNHNQLLDILQDHGLQEIDTDGAFNPALHEATLTKQTNDESKHNHVVDELRKGYKLDDNVLRHAQVTIAQYQEQAKETTTNESQSKEETNE